MVVKNENYEYVVLSGNQTGALLTEYMLSQLAKNNKMPLNPVVVKTIVTTDLARKICESYNVEIIDVLTGFKYIGEKIKEFEERKNKNFIMGFEESYGYLAGTFVRDKDGVIACTLICEMAAFYKSKKMNLYDGLVEIYKKYGYYKEGLLSISYAGIQGVQKIKSIMDSLRNSTPKEICSLKVAVMKDYEMLIEKNFMLGNEMTMDYPKSNVIQLFLEDGSVITARPSGTEPKIKFYFAVVGVDSLDGDNKIVMLKGDIMSIINNF